MLKITYLKHSGFLVETDHTYLLFDYWKGEIPPLDYAKTLYVFASHVHHDHYTKAVYKLENLCQHVEYILSSDIKEVDPSWKKAEHVCFMAPYDSYEKNGLMVKTLFSTDEGVAFIVTVDGKKIYHAGDLHLWYWPGEPDEDNEWHTNRYKEEIAKLEGETFDLAFLVLDPRQDEAYSLGMDYFLSKVKATYVFPMHLWGKYELIEQFKKEHELKHLLSKIMTYDKPGQSFTLE